MINLLSNAVKFTEDGKITVSVDTDEHEDGQYTLRFAVQDTGIGIPESRQGQLFENFSQAKKGERLSTSSHASVLGTARKLSLRKART